MSDNWNDIVCHASGRDPDVGADFGWNLFHAIRSVGKTVGQGVVSVGNKLDKVPVVGKGLHAVYSVGTGPLELTANIASGQRLDHAVMGNLKGQLKAAKDVAPYAQTVVSFVPGVGSGVGAAIAAANALASGRPITEAVLDAAKGALPGGPLAKSAFDMAHAAASGKSISNIALASIPIPDEQKEILRQGLQVAKDVAAGKRVDKILLDRVSDNMKILPKELQGAVSVGVALGHGKNLQTAMKDGAVQSLSTLAKLGADKIGVDSVLKAGHDSIPEGMKKGFAVGAGLVQHKFNPVELSAIRGRLTPEQKNGLDLALSTHVGKLTKQLPAHLDPKLKFGYYAAAGLKNAKKDNQVAIKSVLVKDTKIAKGMVHAKNTAHTEDNLKHYGFWKRVKYMLTGKIK